MWQAHEAREAREVAAACRKAGLRVEERSYDRSGYLPVNEKTNMGLIIEDNALCKEVAQEALRHGIPVRYIEF